MQIGRLGYGLGALVGLGAGSALIGGGVEAVKAADTHREVYNSGYGGFGGGGIGGLGYGGYGGAGNNFAHNDTVENATDGVGIGLLTTGALGIAAGGFGLAKAFTKGNAIFPEFRPPIGRV